MRTFVLLHGAWHGPWCWKKLTPLLTSKGHTVLTPELPWTYNDKIKNQQFNFYTTANSLSELINCLDGQITLVAHSLGGVITSLISANIPEKVSRAVYISGFIPQTGQSINDLDQLMSESIIASNMRVDEKKRALIVSEDFLKEGFYQDCSEVEYKFAKSWIGPQLASTFLAPIQYDAESLSKVNKIYIECLNDRAVPISAQRVMQKNIVIEKVMKVDSGHSPFFSIPQKLANILNNA
ncbi:MAG: alpha/beta fold hydrolase [Gammaproteobacteria bacterium]|nr:alpha/beta fold hydrolase [Gammaproteobacteria bacterium]